MTELSLVEINKLCWDILGDFQPFLDWNKSKKGKEEILFTSRFSKTDPDYDFIDLDALLCNVCLDIRTERREKVKLNEKFEREHGKEL